MKPITVHSIRRATDEAVSLWAYASAQYPQKHPLLLDAATVRILEAVSSFALNARRAMEVLPPKVAFALSQPRWRWDPSTHGGMVGDLRDACNCIVHAQELQVGFEQHQSIGSFFPEGSLVVPYVRAATDRRKLAFIDPFALAHAFLYGALPDLYRLGFGPVEGATQ